MVTSGIGVFVDNRVGVSVGTEVVVSSIIGVSGCKMVVISWIGEFVGNNSGVSVGRAMVVGSVVGSTVNMSKGGTLGVPVGRGTGVDSRL